MAGMLAGGCALVALLWLTWFTLSLRADYRATKANIDAVRAMFAPDGNTGELRPEQLPELAERLGTIELQIRNLDARLDVPVLTPVARHLPWFGPRLRAVEQFLAFGINASDLAHDGANLGNDIYAAWELTGFSGEVDPNAPTWLSAVQANRGQIDTLLLRFDELLQERDALDDEHLPEQATSMLASLDPLMQRAARVREAYVGWLDYYPLIEQALGAREDGRYIVLLLNSQEIRPVGGFPGTYAVITVREGRLFDYTFHNILELDGAYLAARSKPIPAPAPLRRYLEVRELLPRDSGWDPDFPHMAARLLEMYALTGGEPVHGVVAVTDIAVRDVLRSLGPMTVYIQGEPVTVTGDNVVQTIEAYRLGPGERHKDAVRVIGSALLDRIRNGGFAVQRDVLSAMRASADRREIQFYA
ncbi:MAG: hypothetical protein DCC58_18035, partial [Chloroflexi bacterium]